MPQGLAGPGQGQEQWWASLPSRYKWSPQGAVEARAGQQGVGGSLHARVFSKDAELPPA